MWSRFGWCESDGKCSGWSQFHLRGFLLSGWTGQFSAHVRKVIWVESINVKVDITGCSNRWTSVSLCWANFNFKWTSRYWFTFSCDFDLFRSTLSDFKFKWTSRDWNSIVAHLQNVFAHFSGGVVQSKCAIKVIFDVTWVCLFGRCGDLSSHNGTLVSRNFTNIYWSFEFLLDTGACIQDLLQYWNFDL